MKSRILFFMFALLLSSLLSACTQKTVSIAAQWHLISYGDVSRPTPAISGVNTFILFDENGHVEGNVGCNTFTSSYKITEDKIRFGPISATKKVCRNIILQEDTVFSLLSEKESFFDIEENTLRILSADGKTVIVLKHEK